jgi:hypothetical protein
MQPRKSVKKSDQFPRGNNAGSQFSSKGETVSGSLKPSKKLQPDHTMTLQVQLTNKQTREIAAPANLWKLPKPKRDAWIDKAVGPNWRWAKEKK